MSVIRQSTARTILIGPILDSTGAAKTDEVVGSIKITKNGTVGAANGSATLTHDHTGKYKLALTATDCDTVGILEISLNSGTNDMPVTRLCVVEEAVYDALFAASGAGYQVPIWSSAGATVNLSGTTIKTLTDAVALPSSASINITGNITGNLSGSVGSVSGSVGSVTGNIGGNVVGSVGSVTSGVTVTTNNDKTGYSLTQTFPTNFSALSITAGGEVTAGTVSDKTGYSLTQTFPTNFSALSITAGGVVKSDLDTIKTQTVTCAGGVTVPTGTLASTSNITVVNSIATGGITRSSFAADTGLQTVRSGTAQAGAAGTITLDAGASSTTDFYKHITCYITGGTGAGQYRIGTAYNGTTKVLTITPNWTTTPDATSTFALFEAAANITAISGAALSTSTAQLGVNVVNWGGTAVASATVRANAIQFAGQTITCSGAVTIPGSSTLASTTNITAGTITTTTNLTNLPAVTTNWLTAAGIASDAITEIQSGLMLAASYTAPPSAAAIADAVWDEATSGHVTAGTFAVSLATTNDVSAVPGLVWEELQASHTTPDTMGINISGITSNISTIISALPTSGYLAGASDNNGKAILDLTQGNITFDSITCVGGIILASGKTIAETVWDEAISGHLTAGTTGNALNAAGAAGDPWATTLPGAYSAGTAGKIIGDYLDAAISSRMATYTQPTGFLAATFPATVASTTNITSATGIVLANTAQTITSFTITAGMSITNSTTNGHGLSITGNGTGHGALLTSGGVSSDAMRLAGGSTTGNGLYASGGNSGAGIKAYGNYGMRLEALDGGALFCDGNSAYGIVISSDDNIGMYITGSGSGVSIPQGITSNITGTITTATNLTNLPTIPTNWLTAAGLAADAITEIQSGLMLAASYTAPPSAADIADAVWDEATSGHTTIGTFGYNLDAQVSTVGGGSLTAADVWAYGTRELTSGANIGTVAANVTQISGDATAADNAEAFFDGTGYAGTNNVIPTVTTLTNLPAITTDWLTGTGVAASAVTKIQAGLSTYNGSDTSGTATLLTRLSATRAGYLDNLNTVGIVASQADVLAINQSASRRIVLSALQQFELPETGSITFTIELRTYDGDGAAINADSDPSLTATGTITGSLSGQLGVVSNPTTGTYRWSYTVEDTDNIEQIRFDASATIGGDIFTITHYAQTCNFVSTTWTTTDAANLAAILADTNELQTDWANGGRLDLILDSRSSQTSVDDLPTNSELTTALGTADDAILTAISALNNLSAAQVITAMGTGTFLTAIPWNTAWDAEVQSEVTDALTAYDPPTNAEMEARTLPSADYFNPTTDTVAHVTLVDTLTTYTNNTPQTGDAYNIINTRLTSARAGYLDNISAGAVMLASSYTTPPTATTISTQVGTDLSVAHGAGSWTTATGFATINPDNASITAIKTKTDNLPSTASGTDGGLPTLNSSLNISADIKAINSSATAAARLALSANQIIPGTVSTASHTPTTTEFEAADITTPTNEHYNDRVIIFTSGALLAQAAAITNYTLTGGKGHFTVTNLTTAPSNNDTFIII